MFVFFVVSETKKEIISFGLISRQDRITLSLSRWRGGWRSEQVAAWSREQRKIVFRIRIPKPKLSQVTYLRSLSLRGPIYSKRSLSATILRKEFSLPSLRAFRYLSGDVEDENGIGYRAEYSYPNIPNIHEKNQVSVMIDMHSWELKNKGRAIYGHVRAWL